MFSTLKRDAASCAFAGLALFATAVPALSQVTEAQREAVKSQCRSDYMAHCSSVQPGGEAALQCLTVEPFGKGWRRPQTVSILSIR